MRPFKSTPKPLFTYELGCSNEAGDVLKGLGATRILAVYDENLYSTGIVEPILNAIRDSGLALFTYNRVKPNAPDTGIEACKKIAEDNKINGIIGIGGGSAMDTAKGAAITVGKPSPINQYMADIYTGPPLDRTVKLVQVPTTSGTCAEASRTILVMDTQRDIKAQIISQRNKADYVLYDPLLTLGVPPYLTAVTGMDALSHAVDALGSNNRNHWSYKNCGYAIDLIWHGLPKVMEKPDDIEARSDLLFASYLALTGECLGNAGHPMAHAIGGLYHHIPHGHICGWTSPIAMYNGRENCAESIRLIASKMDLDLKSDTLAKDVRSAMIQFARSIGLKPPAEMGCDRESIVRLAPIALRDPILTTADPPVDLEQMKILLAQVYDQEVI